MTDTVKAPSVLLTDAAIDKVAQLLAVEEQDLVLRVAVLPGGCSGMRYELFFDDHEHAGDMVTTFGDVRVVIDEVSAAFLEGATIDFVDTISQQGFTIDNPNASCSCSCGDSCE
ncbi:MAG: iron-sulfur cluster assembly accessory protein [Propionibacteriaceae bacterium]|nr:iron-sulfur cluster assembly accessory protein [Propionibacteriaceae bacterium]